MIGLIQKLKGWLLARVYPYWCPFCPNRFRDKEVFSRHYLEERRDYVIKRQGSKAMQKVRAEKSRRLKAKRKLGRK